MVKNGLHDGFESSNYRLNTCTNLRRFDPYWIDWKQHIPSSPEWTVNEKAHTNEAWRWMKTFIVAKKAFRKHFYCKFEQFVHLREGAPSCWRSSSDAVFANLKFSYKNILVTKYLHKRKKIFCCYKKRQISKCNALTAGNGWRDK